MRPIKYCRISNAHLRQRWRNMKGGHTPFRALTYDNRNHFVRSAITSSTLARKLGKGRRFQATFARLARCSLESFRISSPRRPFAKTPCTPFPLPFLNDNILVSQKERTEITASLYLP